MRKVILALLLVMSCAVSSYSADGIVEIYSEPSGAKVYIDGTSVGITPYHNYDIPIGDHRIKVVYNDKYEPRYWDVVVNAVGYYFWV